MQPLKVLLLEQVHGENLTQNTTCLQMRKPASQAELHGTQCSRSEQSCKPVGRRMNAYKHLSVHVCVLFCIRQQLWLPNTGSCLFAALAQYKRVKQGRTLNRREIQRASVCACEQPMQDAKVHLCVRCKNCLLSQSFKRGGRVVIVSTCCQCCRTT